MFKVTLKIKQNSEWVDGPAYVMDAATLTEFSQEHNYFKVEPATEEDFKKHKGWGRIPTAFAGILK